MSEDNSDRPIFRFAEQGVREIRDHLAGPIAPTDVQLFVLDAPGAGNANHRYQLVFGAEVTRRAADGQPEAWTNGGMQAQTIDFQHGPIKEAGVNGITNEVLIAIVMDRLRGFQAGEYRCRENACALTHFEEGLHWLQQRTLSRMRRGVEGSSQA